MIYDISSGVPYVPGTAVCSVCGIDRPVAVKRYKAKPAGADPNALMPFDAFCADCAPKPGERVEIPPVG